MRDEESDLSFAEFGGSKRLYPAPGIFGDDSESSNPLKRLARREPRLAPNRWLARDGSIEKHSPHPPGASFSLRAETAPHAEPD